MRVGRGVLRVSDRKEEAWDLGVFKAEPLGGGCAEFAIA